MNDLLLTIGGLGMLVLWIYPIIHFIKYLRNKDTTSTNIKTKYGFWKIEGIALAVTIISLGLADSTDTKTSKNDSSTNRQEISRKSVSKRKTDIEENSGSTNVSSQEYSNANLQLAKDLEMDKGFANGTLDRDGNPTATVQSPNEDFAFANYIDNLKFEDDGSLTVYVTSTFKYLPNATKDEIANRIQNIAYDSLSTKIDPSKGVFIQFFNGKYQVGRSSVFGTKDYKWSK